MATIFKAYDIRGTYPDQLDEKLIFQIGRAFADITCEEQKKEGCTLVVGRDMRVSSPALAESIIRGITAQGVNVIDIGLCSTPTFYYGVSRLAADGGMQVSASHNPKEYNGVKIVRRKALPVGYENGIDRIEEKISRSEFRDAARTGTVAAEEGILEKEVDFALQHAQAERIGAFTVVADAANSMGAPYLSRLFERLPACRLVKMNFELDGTFPVHEADPFKEQNIKDLKRRVVEEKADLGIATDGDGDRIFFIDDRGELVEPAIIRGILARIVLREFPGATICYDIRPGRITRDMILAAGGKPSVTRVGHSLIKAQALNENAAFAGESSGHFFFNTAMGMFEMPMIVTLKLLAEISTSKAPFSRMVAPLQKYFHSGEINSRVGDTDRKIKDIARHFSDGEISWLDGITVEYDDFWFNVRPSNTEPLLRLNLEAVSEAAMKARLEEVLGIIRG
jgi:phosphomannomutase